MSLTRERLAELRALVEDESMSWGDCADLQGAFEEIPQDELPEPAENAMFSDMLDELEARLPTTDRTAWVCIDCAAAVAGISDHEAGKRLPEPFAGDRSVVRMVNGTTEECRHRRPQPRPGRWRVIDWHDWPEAWHDEHAEECETRTFDTSPCEGCGDHLAGTRQAVTITVR